MVTVARPWVTDSKRDTTTITRYLAPDAAVTDTRRLVLEIHGSKSTSSRINGRSADKRREEAVLPCPGPRIVVGVTRKLAVCCVVHRASTCSCSIAC